MIEVKVAGMKEIRANFDRVEKSLRAQILEIAGMAGAEIIRQGAMAIAPVRTGRLRASIRQEVFRRKPSYVRIRIGPDVPYGLVVEVGRSKGRGARPFLRPALKRKRRKARQEIYKHLWNAISRSIKPVRDTIRGDLG